MSDLTVQPVTVEHYREPVGIGDTRPRLSWVIRTDLAGWRQAAYELEIEPEDGPVFSSGRVDSAESVLVPWAAPELAQPGPAVGPGPGMGRGRRRALGLERGRRRRGRAAGAGRLVGGAGPAGCCRSRGRAVAGAPCCAGSSSLDRPGHPGPAVRHRARHLSGRAERRGGRRSGAGARAGPATTTGCATRPTTSPPCSAPAPTRSACSWPTAGTAATSASAANGRSTATAPVPSCSWRSTTPMGPGPPSPATAPGGRRPAR